MSGNLREWTATRVGVSPPAYRIKGGSYDNVAGALTCGFSFLSAEETYYYENLGFRCCTPCANGRYLCPGTQACTQDADCPSGSFCDRAIDGSGTRRCSVCADITTDPRNCGGCGIVCSAGHTCENAVCC